MKNPVDEKKKKLMVEGVVACLPDTVNEVQLVYTRPHVSRLPKVSSTYDAHALFREFYPVDRIDYKEFFYAMFLNRANHVLAISRLSEGGLTGTVVDPREVFQMALKLNALAVILSHNHPSGNLKPSEMDKKLTHRIIQAGKIFDIAVLDHLILTSEGYFSFADEGLL